MPLEGLEDSASDLAVYARLCFFERVLTHGLEPSGCLEIEKKNRLWLLVGQVSRDGRTGRRGHDGFDFGGGRWDRGCARGGALVIPGRDPSGHALVRFGASKGRGGVRLGVLRGRGGARGFHAGARNTGDHVFCGSERCGGKRAKGPKLVGVFRVKLEKRRVPKLAVDFPQAGFEFLAARDVHGQR